MQLNKLKYLFLGMMIAIGSLFTFGMVVLAGQVTVPAAPGYGYALIGQPNGNYTPVATSSLGIVGAAANPGGTSGQIQYNANGIFGGAATTTLLPGTNVTISGGTPVVIGSSPFTINASGSGGSSFAYPFINNATTTSITFSNGLTISNITGLIAGNGGLTYQAATSSLGVAGPITFTGTLGGQVGGVGGTFNCTTATGSLAGCLSASDWTTFNNKAGFGYPFPSNATSTLITFNNGLTVNGNLNANTAVFSPSYLDTSGLYGMLVDGTQLTLDTKSGNPITLEDSSGKAANIILTSLTGTKSFTLPNASGTFCLTSTCAAFSYPFPANATSTNITFSGGLTGTLTGNASTATALAANGTNCSAGNYALGVDAGGNAEGCTLANTGTLTSVTGTWPIISSGGTTPNITFGGLSTSTAAVIGSIPYFSGVNTFANISTTSASCAGTVSCSAFTVLGSGPITITGSGGGGGSFPFSADTNYSQTVYSTTTPTLWFKGGVFASSTSHFVNADFTGATTTNLFVGTPGGGGDSYTTIGAANHQWSYGTLAASLNFEVASGTALGTNSALDILKSNGFVGIGTTTPYSMLSVAGQVVMQNFISTSTTATSTIAGGLAINGGGLVIGTLSGTQCLHEVSGVVFGTGSDCGSGGGGGISDPFTHPFANASATTSLMLFNGGASTTVASILGPLYVGRTSTTTINGDGATSTIRGSLLVASSSQTALTVQDGSGNTTVNVNTNPAANAPIFQVQATSTTATLFQVDQYGHLTASSTPKIPTVSSCGTGSPALTAGSNDTTGDVTTGTSASACTITFGSPYSTIPEVFITDSNTSAVVDISARSTTAFTISIASALSAVNISYFVVMP